MAAAQMTSSTAAQSWLNRVALKLTASPAVRPISEAKKKITRTRLRMEMLLSTRGCGSGKTQIQAIQTSEMAARARSSGGR